MDVTCPYSFCYSREGGLVYEVPVVGVLVRTFGLNRLTRPMRTWLDLYFTPKDATQMELRAFSNISLTAPLKNL